MKHFFANFKPMWAQIMSFRRAARATLKRNYASMVAVCFIVAIVTGTYATSTAAIRGYSEDLEHRTGVVGDTGTVTTNSETFWDIVQAISKNSVEHANGGDIGVINSAIDALTQAQTPFFHIANSIYSFVVRHSILNGILMLVGVALFALYTVFVGGVLEVGEKRYMLEARKYSATPIRRLFSLYKDKTALHAAFVMAVRDVKIFLWLFTLFYWPVKFYEYRMIPYIVAENPQMPAKQVFARSKQLMQGHKMQLFTLDLSFAGWWLLSFATGGLLSWLFVNPYRTQTETQMYCTLCGETEIIADFPENPCILDEKQHHHFSEDYERSYSLITLIMLFFTFSILGWVWEVALELVTNGILVNRGVLLGPWLPIYGSAGIAMLVLLKPIRKRPVLTFFACMVVSGTIEYFTSWFLQATKGIKWWDYSGYFLNINGRICLEGVIVFGLGGSLFIYFLAPLFAGLYSRIPRKTKVSICTVLITLFALDAVHSHFHPNTGKGITDYGTESTTASQTETQAQGQPQAQMEIGAASKAPKSQ